MIFISMVLTYLIQKRLATEIAWKKLYIDLSWSKRYQYRTYLFPWRGNWLEAKKIISMKWN